MRFVSPGQMARNVTTGAGELLEGIGQGGFGGLDDMIAMQAEQRAGAARARAIDDIKAGYQRNGADPAVQQTMAANYVAGDVADDTMTRAAIAERGQPGWLSMEALNQQMADSRAARYGVIGAAGLGGGALATAGAQKIAALMGLLQESDETEVARDQPLTS